jgi:hypothetical protein
VDVLDQLPEHVRLELLDDHGLVLVAGGLKKLKCQTTSELETNVTYVPMFLIFFRKKWEKWQF